jgi:hypothetical protein
MPSISFKIAATASIFHVLFATASAAACSEQADVATTFYGWPDNSPAGAAIAFDCGRGFNAGGNSSHYSPISSESKTPPAVGTYNDPITFASSTQPFNGAMEFRSCEIIYHPYLRKYLIFEDDCEQCTDEWKRSGKRQLDVWTGSSTSDGGQAQIDCEDALTPDAQTIIRNPSANLPVDTAMLFADGTCATGHVYPNADAASFCSAGGGGSGSGSGSATVQSTSATPITFSTAASSTTAASPSKPSGRRSSCPSE